MFICASWRPVWCCSPFKAIRLYLLVPSIFTNLLGPVTWLHVLGLVNCWLNVVAQTPALAWEVHFTDQEHQEMLSGGAEKDFFIMQSNQEGEAAQYQYLDPSQDFSGLC